MRQIIAASVLSAIFSLFAPNVFASLVEEIDIDGYSLALIPYNHGRVWQTSTYYIARYPSLKQNMQFMLFYNANSTTGYYVQTEDPAGHLTDWEIRTSASGNKILRLTFHGPSKPNIVKQTITIAPDKPYLVAAEKYKGWAFQQPWAKRKPSKMDSVKYHALGASPYYYWLNTELPPLLSKFEDSATNINNPATATWLTLWRADDLRLADGGAGDDNEQEDDYPRYTPAMGSNWGTLLSSLHNRGSIPMPYINACLWDVRMNDPDGISGHQFSQDNMIKSSSGDLVYYSNLAAFGVCMS